MDWGSYGCGRWLPFIGCGLAHLPFQVRTRYMSIYAVGRSCAHWVERIADLGTSSPLIFSPPDWLFALNPFTAYPHWRLTGPNRTTNNTRLRSECLKFVHRWFWSFVQAILLRNMCTISGFHKLLPSFIFHVSAKDVFERLTYPVFLHIVTTRPQMIAQSHQWEHSCAI